MPTDDYVKNGLIEVFRNCVESKPPRRGRKRDEFRDKLHQMCVEHLERAVDTGWVLEYDLDSNMIVFADDVAKFEEEEPQHMYKGHAVDAVAALRAGHLVYDYDDRYVFINDEGTLAYYDGKYNKVYGLNVRYLEQQNFTIYECQNKVIVSLPTGTRFWYDTDLRADPECAPDSLEGATFRIVSSGPEYVKLVEYNVIRITRAHDAIICVRTEDILGNMEAFNVR